MNNINYWLTKEDAEEMLEEIRFVSGKAQVSEDRAMEMMKIGLLTRILDLLEEQKGDEKG